MRRPLRSFYACCCALLCLLHQQQSVRSLTIIIDGATTNEWNTRDEYQRLVGAPQALAPQTDAQAAASELGQPAEPAGDQLDAALDQLERLERQRHQPARPALGRARHRNLQPQQQQPLPDWTPQQQQRQQQQQQLQHRLHQSELPEEQAGAEESRVASNELTGSPRRRERESAPKKYCGPALIDVLDLVCRSRFYRGSSGEAQVVNPSIKSKRYLSRRVRGAVKDCCERPCRMEDLKPYCEPGS